MQTGNDKKSDLDKAIEETFPASDPLAVPTDPVGPDVTKPIPKGQPVPGAPKPPV